MQTAELPLPKEDRLELTELHTALTRANDIFERLTKDTQRQIDEIQNPVASLPYCLKWGLKACAELVEKSTATASDEVWVTEAQLAKHVRVGPTTLKKLIRQKVLVPMVREGTAYFGLQECRKALTRHNQPNGSSGRLARAV